MNYRRGPRVFLFKVIALCALLSVLSCASSPPDWVMDAETVYPPEDYIARPGRGSNRQQAELSGIQAISRWFASEVKSSVSAQRQYSEQDGEVSQSTRIDEQVFVQSQTQLFAVRYTEAWYNDRAAEWEVLAYIDRAEAWAIYEPALRQKADAFRSLYRAAETDAQPIQQFYLYQAARGAAPELERLLDFARVLRPAGAAAFSDVEEAFAALAQKTAAARTGTRIYIDCPVDSEGAVYSALARAFGGLGFTVEQNKEAASAVCGVTVNENTQKLEAGTFYTPEITLNLTGKTGPLFTWSAAAQRAGAFNPDIARRRAYAALVREIEKSLAGEFTRAMSNF